MGLIIVSFGKKELDQPKEHLQDFVRKSLLSMNASKLVTDYSEGWNQLVLDEARKIGLPYVGAIPFMHEDLKFDKVYNSALSNTIFNDSKKGFLNNPFSYFKWVDSYSDEVFAYVNETENSFESRALKFLKNKTVRNIYKLRG